MSFKKILIMVAVSFLLSPACLAAEAPGKERYYSLFTEANDAFRKANSAADDTSREKLYDKSILAFEKIISEGRIQNAKLYYNLANAYLLKGDVGRAILNYRRAEKVDNTNPDIKKNLAFARGRRIDKVPVKAEKRVLRTLFFWHYDFSLKTKFLLSCIFFAIVCISLTVMVWFGRRASMTVTVVICGILMLCLFGSVVVETRTNSALVCGVITVDEVIARQGDGQNYPASFKEPLHEGTEFDLLEQRGGWLHIKLTDDSQAWITKSSAELI